MKNKRQVIHTTCLALLISFIMQLTAAAAPPDAPMVFEEWSPVYGKGLAVRIVLMAATKNSIFFTMDRIAVMSNTLKKCGILDLPVYY
jgi:hypothetical protein